MIASRTFWLAIITVPLILKVSSHATVSVLELTHSAGDHFIVYPTEGGMGVAYPDEIFTRISDVVLGQPYMLGSEVTFEQSHARVAYTVTMTSSQWIISGEYTVAKMAGHTGAIADLLSLSWGFHVTEPTPFLRRVDVLETPVSDGIYVANVSFFVHDFGPDLNGVEGEEGVFLPGTYEYVLFGGLSASGETDESISGDYRFKVSITIPEPETSALALIGLCGCMLVRRRGARVREQG